MIFKIYNCDFGFKLDSTNYDFEDVVSLSVESVRRTRLTRGANAKNKAGIVFEEGVREPDKWTVIIQNMSEALQLVLLDAYKNKKRLDVYAIDRTSGSSKMARTGVLSNQPQQLTLDDSPDSMNVQLEFETFDSTEVHKDA